MTNIPKVKISTAVVKKIANEIISALKLVTAVNDTNVEISEPDTFENAKVLGVSTIAANTGEKVKIQTFGELKDAFFTFALNVPLFLGSGGTITDTPPSVDHSVTIGHSLGNGAIFIDIQEPIEFC